MSNEIDSGLGWLEDESGAPNDSEERPKGSALSKDILNWLSESDDGSTMSSNESSESASMEPSALGWLADQSNDLGEGLFDSNSDVGGDSFADSQLGDSAPALVNDPDDSITPGNTGSGTSESMFSAALEDFFSSIEDGEESQSQVSGATGLFGSNIELSSSTSTRVRDNRFDRIINNLLRYLTRKEPIREEQLDSIFSFAVGRLVDAINAEVVGVFFATDEGPIVIGHVFYSKTLFAKKDASFEKEFLAHLNDLGSKHVDPGHGVVGRCLSTKQAITVLDVRNDDDYVQIIGKGTRFEARSLLTVPISDPPHVYGAIQLINKDPISGEEFFSFRDSKMVEEISGYIARIIHRMRDPSVLADDLEMARYIARLSKCELIDLESDNFELDFRLWEIIGLDNVRKYKIIPLKKVSSSGLRVVMSNPLDFQRRAGFEAKTEYAIEEAVVAGKEAIQNAIQGHLVKGTKRVNQSEISDIVGGFKPEVEKVEVELTEDEEDLSPVVKLVNRIIEDAYARGASDIHIEPFEEKTRVRYRIDGVCHEALELPPQANQPLVSRLKIMSDLDISERRLPQDGKIKFKRWSRSGIDVDLRIATGPMAFGEKCCLRLLVKGAIALGLDAMGFSPENMKLYRFAAKQPYGMILNVGPTGSGKTTTLYSALTEVSVPEVNVHTAEDPIEYPLFGINQMQMHKDIGLTFASALRCFLRMDPDIILVGEIRDLETAEIAVEAALTGHLLFSTLHTNDAAGTIVRFIEMGIEPFMVSSSILLVCAQRLCRRICKHCREEVAPTQEDLNFLRADARPIDEFYRHNPKGCVRCNRAGYKGRCGVHEVLTLNDDIRSLVNKSASSDLVKSAARKNGMMTMYQDGLWKVKSGTTDLEELFANIKQDRDFKR